ncbi:MAG: polysaccharide biosynthesis protein [Alphaproteobacteria bacterium]|nr:polysaccharide biosynthesis protein [Alphaproteobacteria bacterium]
MVEHVKRLGIKAFLWSASESFGLGLLSLAVFVLLARLLEPQDFGVVALAGVFVFTFNLIIGTSFADALVQRAELEPGHMDAAFWTTLAVSLLLAGGSFALADLVARETGEAKVAQVLPWLALSMPLNAIATVQTALFRRALQFRVIAIRSIFGRTIGAAVGIGMALSGFGVWSLVGQQLAGVAVSAVALAAHSSWRPRLSFSFGRLRDLAGFGLHVSASQVINGLAEQAVTFVVGILFGTTALGFFTIAWRVVQLIRALVGSAVYHVGFSAFSRLQQDRTALTAAVLQSTRFACLFGFPIGAGIAALAGPIIVLLFGSRWLVGEPLLILLALEMIPGFYVIFFAPCFRAMGRPGLTLMLSLVYGVSGIAAVVALAPFGLQVAVLGWVARTFVLLPLQIFLLQRMLQVPLRKVVAPVLAPAIATLVMAVCVTALVWFAGGKIDNAALVALGVAVGVLVYAAGIALLARDLLRFVLQLPHTLRSANASAPAAATEAAELDGGKLPAGA